MSNKGGWGPRSRLLTVLVSSAVHRGLGKEISKARARLTMCMAGTFVCRLGVTHSYNKRLEFAMPYVKTSVPMRQCAGTADLH
jgi:hypothetical protein